MWDELGDEPGARAILGQAARLGAGGRLIRSTAVPGRVHVLEHQAGLRVGDLGAGAQVLQHERPQLGGVAHRHVHQHVVDPREQVHVPHLGPLRQPVRHLGEPGARGRLQPDRDHRLQPAADRLGVHLGVEAAQHAGLAQRPHAGVARRRGDPGERGELLVGDPPVALELAEQAPVDVVELDGAERAFGADRQTGAVTNP